MAARTCLDNLKNEEENESNMEDSGQARLTRLFMNLAIMSHGRIASVVALGTLPVAGRFCLQRI